RGAMPNLANQVVDIDEPVIDETFKFLCVIARRLAEKVGDKILLDWLRSRRILGRAYTRDKWFYSNLKRLTFYVGSRNDDLPVVTAAHYSADYLRANP